MKYKEGDKVIFKCYAEKLLLSKNIDIYNLEQYKEIKIGKIRYIETSYHYPTIKYYYISTSTIAVELEDIICPYTELAEALYTNKEN